LPPDGTIFSAAHHYRTEQQVKNAEMTDQQGKVHFRQAADRDEFNTRLKFFCTKTAQWVYAECFDIRHLPSGGVNR
jgi:hypothetical protein